MYIFANDYVRIYDNRNRLKFEGYYRSTKNVKEKRLYFRNNNSSSNIDKTIAQKDTIKKYNVDILGNLGGEVKCSEPFMLLPEK